MPRPVLMGQDGALCVMLPVCPTPYKTNPSSRLGNAARCQDRLTFEECVGFSLRQLGVKCKGQQVNTKVVNSGFTNSAGFQWLTSGSRVARSGPAGFLPNVANYGLKSVPYLF